MIGYFGYLLLPLAGLSLMVSPRGEGRRRFSEMLLLGPLAVYVAMLLFAGLGVKVTPPRMFGLFAALLLLSRLWSARTSGWQVAEDPDHATPWWIKPALLVLLVLMVTCSLAAPIFISDPVNIYAAPATHYAAQGQLHPRFLADVVEPEHLDYPPLYTAALAWLFQCRGEYDGWIMKPLGVVFWWGLLLELNLLATTLGIRKARIALVAFFVLVPLVFKQALSGFADLALTAYVAGGLTSCVALSREGATRHHLWRAGLFWAAAALTKNEGAALAVVTLGLMALLPGRSPFPRRRLLGVLLIVVALTLPWSWWVRHHGIENDLVEGVGQVSLAEGIGRIPEVVSWLARDSMRPIRVTLFDASDSLRLPPFGLVFPVFVVVFLWRIWQGIRARRKPHFFVALAPLQLGLYTTVFCFTPRDLAWHLDTAAPRLLMQCIPAIALLVFSSVAPNDESEGDCPASV